MFGCIVNDRCIAPAITAQEMFRDEVSLRVNLEKLGSSRSFGKLLVPILCNLAVCCSSKLLQHRYLNPQVREDRLGIETFRRLRWRICARDY